MCRSTLVFVGLLTVFYSVITADAAIAAEPAINKQGANWTLELPEKLKRQFLSSILHSDPGNLKITPLAFARNTKKQIRGNRRLPLSLTQIMMEGQT